MKRLERENIYIYMYIDIEMFDCLAFAKSPMIGGFGDSNFFFFNSTSAQCWHSFLAVE